MKRENLLHFLFALGIIGFFLYSFTQIDLSLTLSKASVWQDIQKSFQHIGYFQRPLSTLIFLILTLFLFLIYSLYLKFSLANKLTRKKVWYLIIFISIVLSFSYNAFSYDIFNNIFDAKILTYYHQNPFIHKALDFPNDSMLSFMHWTHRTYPYGPMALILTLPASFLGIGNINLICFVFSFCLQVLLFSLPQRVPLNHHAILDLPLFFYLPCYNSPPPNYCFYTFYLSDLIMELKIGKNPERS